MSFCANNWAITVMGAKAEIELKCTVDFVDASQTIKIDNVFYKINLQRLLDFHETSLYVTNIHIIL